MGMGSLPMLLLGVGLVAALVVLVVLVVISTRRNAPGGGATSTVATAEERDPYEEALLADDSPPKAVPGYPTASGPATVAPGALDRDALLNRDRSFDPGGWDDRPDGYEGTDMGLVGGDKG